MVSQNKRFENAFIRLVWYQTQLNEIELRLGAANVNATMLFRLQIAWIQCISYHFMKRFFFNFPVNNSVVIRFEAIESNCRSIYETILPMVNPRGYTGRHKFICTIESR